MGRFFLFICIFITLDARENPFFSTNEGDDITISINRVKELESFDKQSIKLDSSARVLKSVTLEYKNLDGSIEHKTINIEKKIDWHNPIEISQIKPIKPEPIVAKKDEPKESVRDAVKTDPYLSKIEPKAIGYSVEVYDKKIKLYGSDKLLREFMISMPCRVVLDFESAKMVKNQTIKVSSSIFTDLRIGYHDGYYRMVFEVDGKYRYKLNKTPYGYDIEFF